MDEQIQHSTNLDARFFERIGALHYRDDVMLFEQPAFRYHANRLLQFDYAMLAFVVDGQADMQIEERTYHLENHDQLILLPGQNTAMKYLSDDFRARFVLLSKNFVSYLTTEDSYVFVQMIRNNPIIRPGGQVVNTFDSCYDLLKATLMQEDNPYQRQMLYHIIKTYIYGTMYYTTPEVPVVRTREEELTYRFMELVEHHYREHHSLGFYAEKMHLTGKYISKCVTQSTGQSGMHVIAGRIIQQAKLMLLTRQKTIAQIGFELGFSDQSAFGKFFCKHTGESPQRWRLNH